MLCHDRVNRPPGLSGLCLEGFWALPVAPVSPGVAQPEDTCTETCLCMLDGE